MGMLDFIRDTGEKLTEMGEEAKLASRIEKRIISLGVKVKGLDVDVDGEMVVLNGFPVSEEDRAKAVQIAGNVRGIAKVYDKMSFKGQRSRGEKPAKTMKKNVKEPRHGGKKVRPPESSRKKVKHAKRMKRRTP